MHPFLLRKETSFCVRKIRNIVGILPSSGDDGVVPGWVGAGSAASAEVAV